MHDLTPRDKLLQERQKKCAAEAAEWRRGFNITGTPNSIFVEFVKNDPKLLVSIECCTAFLDQWNFNSEAGTVCMLACDWKQQEDIATLLPLDAKSNGGWAG